MVMGTVMEFPVERINYEETIKKDNKTKDKSGMGVGQVQEPTSFSSQGEEESVGLFGGNEVLERERVRGAFGRRDETLGEVDGVTSKGESTESEGIRRGEDDSTKEEIVAYIKEVFSAGGDIAEHWGLDIASCESNYNPVAYNSSGASGIYQYLGSTFYGNGGIDIRDWREQTRIAYRMFSEGQRGQWECSYLIYGY